MMKRLNQWLGLCTAVRGDRREAAEMFARAARLPGPPPDPQVFPPAIMALYARAAQSPPTARCAPVQAAGVRLKLIDGRTHQTDEATTVGHHYAAWEGGSGLITINGTCRMMPLRDPPLSEQDALVSSRELEDDSFTAALAVRTQTTKLAFRHMGSGRKFVYRLAEGRLMELPSATRGPDLRATATSSPTSSRSSNRRALSPDLTGPVSSRPYSADSARPPWYERWWVWALVGGVVVTSVVIPVALTGSDDPTATTYTLSF